MKLSAIRHRSFYPFVQALARNMACFSVETAAGDIARCTMVYWKRTRPELLRRAPMAMRFQDRRIAQWRLQLAFPEEIHYVKYYFVLEDHDGNTCYLNEYGVAETAPLSGFFELLQVNETDLCTVPPWSKGIVYYQIFPERFARSESPSQPSSPSLASWDAEPTRDNLLGGTLAGIAQKMDYLQDLGVECIYMTPVFEADFNHKYATTDYFRVDPAFGTEQDLCALVSAAHARGIRIVLDGVFNHCGIRFKPFADLLKNGERSAYKNWFYPKRFPIRIDASCYECVGDYPYMPRLNGANPEVRAYIESVLLYWLEKAGIDGWRFDVADELDQAAVLIWRQAVKARFPNALMLCETWGNAAHLLGPRGFDSAMNYLFRDAMTDYFAKGVLTPTGLDDRLQHMLMCYGDEANAAMYNCLGSHDTPRFLTLCGEEAWRYRLASAFQLLFPGAPALYYGDEVGMLGGNDPGCRGGMRWENQDEELLSWIKALIALRKAHPVLREGSYRTLYTSDEKQLFAFLREDERERICAVFNSGDVPRHVDLTETIGSVDVQPRSVEIIHQFKRRNESCVTT